MTRRNLDSDLWVMTTYFNLAGWSSRLENYRAFRRALRSPLLTVEWNPGAKYQLGGGDADLLLQIAGGDAMWQKERLLGRGLAALPAHVRYVAWVDCDVIFADPAWHENTRRLLEHHPVVQPYRRAVYLDEEVTRRVVEGAAIETIPQDGAFSRPSFLDVFERLGDDITRVDLGRRFVPAAGGEGRYNFMDRPAYGHAWAAQRDVIRRIGFYDRCVVGAGDLLFDYAIIGHSEELIANHRSVGWDFYGDSASYREWARTALSICRGRTRCGEGTLLHLFHGSLDDRQYKSRIDGLLPFRLDLDQDIVAAPGEPWSWRRRETELSGYFLSYLRKRREDG